MVTNINLCPEANPPLGPLDFGMLHRPRRDIFRGVMEGEPLDVNNWAEETLIRAAKEKIPEGATAAMIRLEEGETPRLLGYYI